MQQRGAGRCARAVAPGLAACLALACASPLDSVGQGEQPSYRHRELGYRIDRPEAGQASAGWRKVKIKGTDLSFVEPGGAVMSLFHDCERTAASPRLLARNLMIGLGDRAVRESESVELAGDAGWSMVFDTQHDGVPVRIKSVTLQGGDCVYDWVLVAPQGFRDPERSFDDWWQSFARPGATQVVAETDP